MARARVENTLDLGQDNAAVLVDVPSSARWARVQAMTKSSATAWSTGDVLVKWTNLGGANEAQPLDTAVTLTASVAGSNRIPVSAIEQLVMQTGTAQAGVKLVIVVVFDDLE